MVGPPPDGPDLAGVIAAANDAGLPFVIIGGFAVVAHQYVRATEDVDLFVSGDRALDPQLLAFLDAIAAHRQGVPLTAAALAEIETLRVRTRLGLVDLLREGLPPLDFATVWDDALEVSFHGHHARVASLNSLVAFKRLANRPRDQLDLLELERIHGVLPAGT
jgi:predicted nucleotidyltransferase